MSLVRADFKRQAIPSRWLWWALALAGFAAAAATFLAWREWRQVTTQRDSLRQTIAAQAAAPIAAPPVKGPAPYDASARTMLAEQASLWPQALTMIEATAIIGVTPAALEFVANDKSVRVEVSFTDYAKLLEYVDALNAGEPEIRWVLVQSHAQAGGAATAVVVSTPSRR